MKTLSILFVVFGLSVTLSAQAPELRNYEITLLAVQEDIRDLYIPREGKAEKLFIPSAEFDDALSLQSDGRFALYRKDDEGGMQVAAQCTLPGNTRHVLILLFPHPEKNEQYQLMPMDFSNRNFPSGSFRILNMTRDPLIGSIGNTRERFAPGSSQLIQPSSSSRTLPVLFAAPGQSLEDSLLSTTWFYNPRHRYLVFLYPGADKERVGIRTIRHIAGQ